MSMTENVGAGTPAPGKATKKAKKDKPVWPSELPKGAKKAPQRQETRGNSL